MNTSKRALIAVGVMVFAMSSLAFAGSWGKDSNGWYYLNDDGTYATSGWQWIDGNNDGTAECYCFDAEGYLYTNTMIDDAKVDSNGAWIQDGVVKTKNTSKSDNSILHQSINSNNSSNNSVAGHLQPGTYYCKSSYTINSYYDASGNIVPTGTVYLGASEDEYIVLTGDTQKLNFEYYDWYTTRFSPDTDPLKMKGTFTRNSDGTYSVKNIDHTEKRNGKTWYPDEVDYSITSISDITSESFVIYNWSDGDGRSDSYTTMVRR